MNSFPEAQDARRLWWLACGLLLAGGAVMPWDITVARAARGLSLPGDVGRIITLSEAFAHGAGALIILLAVWLLDPRLAGPAGRRSLLVVISGSVTGGLVTDVIKLVVDRVRPRAVDFSMIRSAFDTFTAPEGLGGSNLHSFPSGHAATAAGLATMLALRYPRGRWLFAGLAVMACVQRITSSAHYPSDVLCGAALGVAGAVLWAGFWPSATQAATQASPTTAGSIPHARDSC